MLSILVLAITIVATGCMGILNAQQDPQQPNQAPPLPAASQALVAHAYVSADGSIASGSMNVKRGSYNQTALQYEIPIDGIDYYYSDYTTIVTVSGSDPIFATTNSVEGKLVVMLHDTTGGAPEEDFQFVIYKQ